MTAGPVCLIDGLASDRLSVTDRGLAYGDGLFETLAAVDGRPRYWSRHLTRLARGCARLGLVMPDEDLLAAEAAQLLATRRQAVLKLILTRGSGGRGYRPPQPAQPRRIFSVHDWPAAAGAAQPIAVRWCTHPLSLNPRLAGLKHLNRLDQVLARSEWDEEFDEGLMRDLDGGVIEATAANLFFVRDGVLVTPLLDRAGICGVMRERLLELATAAGLPWLERRADMTEVEAASELFLSNSVFGIRPIARLGERSFPAPGPLTTRLLACLATDCAA